MRLTGKAKDQFEKWLIQHNIGVVVFGDDEFTVILYGLSESMQWGVVQDFADSLGISMETEALFNCSYYWRVFTSDENGNDGTMYTRQEARNEAIKHLNEILNETNWKG